MSMKDPRIDAYIARSADFAKPILTRLRSLIYKGCPEVHETIKWGMPSFEHQGILCGFAAFKQHCTFGFWKSKLMKDPKGYLEGKSRTAMGNLGRMASLSDLPPDSVILGFIRQAVKLNEQGMKVERSTPTAKKPLRVPPALKNALAKSSKARTTFENFSPSHKRDYIEWISEAKSVETRKRRTATAIEWMSQGKARNWKYMGKRG